MHGKGRGKPSAMLVIKKSAGDVQEMNLREFSLQSDPTNGHASTENRSMFKQIFLVTLSAHIWPYFPRDPMCSIARFPFVLGITLTRQWSTIC